MIRTLKSGKSGGLSGIRNEFLKLCPGIFINELTNLYNQIIMIHKIPESWKKHRIKPIPKEGKEFRPISLIEKSRKLFEKLILNKMHFKLIKQQAGFKKEHRTLNHALTLDNELRCSNGSLICVSLDIRKAYDSVNRIKLYEKLAKLQKFPFRDTLLIATLIENNRYTIEKTKESSAFKNACVGLPQGSILSPSLFNVFIDDLLEYMPANCRKKLLLYADDILIFSNRIDEIHEMIANIERHAKDNSYLLNAKKCFYNTNIKIEIRVNNIEIVKQSPIKYLGYYFNLKCADTKKNLKIARTNALKATAILKSALRKNIFNNSGDIFRYMLRGYISYVRPHIDYPITLLGLNKTFTEDCDRIQKGIIKNLFGIYYKTPSRIIYGIFPIETIKQRSRRLSLINTHKILNGKRTSLYTNFRNNNTKIFKTMKKTYLEHINEEMVQGTTIKFSNTISELKKKNLQKNLDIFKYFKNLKNFNWNTETKERLGELLEVVNFENKKEKFEEILKIMNDKR
ncbi:reverse transcriptase [Hamiltosporidium tvaerminnensis]|uniref:Reverse transcriptase n=1 Tax=Hamiltosporidium tvaerminnensis TaxID=1176355 RepID=A0A4Q9LLN8_9MICR|nr:reverse transcriptase [Hamiltosporidium tvaerminnensis]